MAPPSPLSLGWMKRFLERHNALKKTKGYPVECSRVLACTKDNLSMHFSRLKYLYDTKKYTPNMIFNFDETMLEFSKSRPMVIAPRDMDAVPVPQSDVMLHITLGVCISAVGQHSKTLAILPKVYLPRELDYLSDVFCWSGQNAGWITTEILEKWTSHVFIPFVICIRESSSCEKSERALLILDGHSSRASAETMSLMNEAHIDVLTIPAHTSHLTQPLDCGVFRAFKTRMKRASLIDAAMSLSDRRKLLLEQASDALDHALCRKTVVDSFAHSGVWPLKEEEVLSKTPAHSPEALEKKKKKTRKALNISGRVMTDPLAIAELEEHEASQKDNTIVSAGTQTMSDNEIEVESDIRATELPRHHDLENPCCLGYDFRPRRKPRLTEKGWK